MEIYGPDLSSQEDSQDNISIVSKLQPKKCNEVTDTLKFIRLISQRPPLFNYQLPIEERKRTAVKGLWIEVSQKMGNDYSVTYCRKKWRNLRDTYHQYRLRKVKLQDNSFQRWRYSKELDFLKKIYKSKPKKTTNKICHVISVIEQAQDSQSSSQSDYIENQIFMENSQVEDIQPSSEKYELTESECVMDNDYNDDIQNHINQEEHLIKSSMRQSMILKNDITILQRGGIKNEEINEVDQHLHVKTNQSKEEVDLFFYFLKKKVSKLPAKDMTDIQIELLNVIRKREMALLE